MRERIAIETLSYGPDGIGHRANGQVVFVEGTAPGDVVDVEIDEDRGSFSRGHCVAVVDAGPARVGESGDAVTSVLAPWSHVAYDAQLAAKRTNVIDALVKVAEMDRAEAETIVGATQPSPERDAYRNKIELSVDADESGRLRLGVRARESQRFIPVERYPLAPAALADAPRALTGALRYIEGNGATGIFRVSVRASQRTRAFEVALWTDRGSFPRAAAKALASALPTTSIVRVVADRGAARRVRALERLDGRGTWKERLAGCAFTVSAPAFFQVNTAVAEAIVERAKTQIETAAALTPSVVDLFAGVGTFAVPLLKADCDVIAVEREGAAVRNLRTNAASFDERATIIGGDVARSSTSWRAAPIAIVDPPRSGLDAAMPSLLAESEARTLIYVSCDPQTWARDVKRLAACGFHLEAATPFDMFPQTYHGETFSHFRRVESRIPKN